MPWEYKLNQKIISNVFLIGLIVFLKLHMVNKYKLSQNKLN